MPHNQPAAAASSVTCGILAPWRRAITRLFRVPGSAALSIRAFRFRNLRKGRRRRRGTRTFRSVRAVFWRLVPPSFTPAASTAEGEAATAPEETVVVQETPPVHAPVSSPETPAYMKVVLTRLRSGRSAAGGDGGEDEEDENKETNEAAACRNFESRLVEMLVEEGKVRDVQDVEELLRCWVQLKSPVFVDLVRRFYGELCSDLLFADAAVVDDDTDGGGGCASTSSP